MDTGKNYTCNYCYKEYTPSRRGAQKYCSNSCRSNGYRLRHKSSAMSKIGSITQKKSMDRQKEKMSIAGVGNATAGVLLANTLRSAFTKEDNRPATKGDLKKLIQAMDCRYLPIKNLSSNLNGEMPFYDVLNNNLVYVSSAMVTFKK